MQRQFEHKQFRLRIWTFRDKLWNLSKIIIISSHVAASELLVSEGVGEPPSVTAVISSRWWRMWWDSPSCNDEVAGLMMKFYLFMIFHCCDSRQSLSLCQILDYRVIYSYCEPRHMTDCTLVHAQSYLDMMDVQWPECVWSMFTPKCFNP